MTSSWQLWRDRRGRLSPLRIGTLALLLFPLAKALVDAQAIMHGARPLNDMIHRAGFWALVFLGVTLAVTPFRRIAALRQSDRRAAHARRRRVLLHRRPSHAVYRRPDVRPRQGRARDQPSLVSHRRRHRLARPWRRWPPPRPTAWCAGSAALRWRRLHQIVYGIALLALIHYFQQTKADVTVPVFAASLFLWLIAYRLVAWWQGSGELSTLTLLALSVAVSVLTFIGEAVGIGIAFHVSPMRVLDVAFDFSAGIRPGWEVLAAGLVVVAIDFVRGALVQPRGARARGGGGVEGTSMATFVVAHGAWSAGWAWKKMHPLMAARGHRLITPTYTGLGERGASGASRHRSRHPYRRHSRRARIRGSERSQPDRPFLWRHGRDRRRRPRARAHRAAHLSRCLRAR